MQAWLNRRHENGESRGVHGARSSTNLEQWRKYRGLNQEELAERVGKTRGLISQLETGHTALTEDTRRALEDALGAGPGDLDRINPLANPEAADAFDLLKDADPAIKAKAIAYIRGLVDGAKH